jgi:hypothetical protein
MSRRWRLAPIGAPGLQQRKQIFEGAKTDIFALSTTQRRYDCRAHQNQRIDDTIAQ